MTDDDKALVEVMKDAVLHGTGFMKNGKHVPIDDVYFDPRDARIEALSAENERLREALREIIDFGDGDTGYGNSCAKIARAALGETK